MNSSFKQFLKVFNNIFNPDTQVSNGLIKKWESIDILVQLIFTRVNILWYINLNYKIM